MTARFKCPKCKHKWATSSPKEDKCPKCGATGGIEGFSL